MQTLREIAKIIREDFGRSKSFVCAEPYVEAMEQMDSVTDKYFYDDGRDIVNYFLANAQGWRGEIARDIKGTLKQMLKDAA